MAEGWKEVTEIEKKLMTARALTATTGIMHDIQIQLLKNWAALGFGAWYGWESHIDIPGKTILYKLTPEGKFKPKAGEMKACVAALERSIHWLLGPDWATNIDIKGKPHYRGSREVKRTNEQRKKRVEKQSS